MTNLFAPFVNFFVFVGFLGYKLRGPLKAFVQERHESTRDQLIKAERELKAAKIKFEEFSSKLDAMGTETAALRMQAKEEGQAAVVKLVNDAKKLADIIISDARAASASAEKEFKAGLARDLGEQVIAKVEGEILNKLSDEQKKKFRTVFAEDLKRTS